ncbi:hypothetical protein [Arthrobacter sp. H5]|uniref:hypothetical protein n=1 Tax=Arthrobacter sp. H5 TaxID=1267973 RepID=UPI000487ED21|nr:hypothetical protein [Arthrobacter sp. H5]
MTSAVPTDTRLAGHNRISTQALTSTARAVASEVFGIPAREIRASWSDDDGLLALRLALPIGIPSLDRTVRDGSLVAGFGGSIWDRAHAAKAMVLEQVSRLSGSQLSRVDIRIIGIKLIDGGRTR